MILPAGIRAVYLDNYSSAASAPFAIYGCINADLTLCTFTITGFPALVVDDDPLTSFDITKSASSVEPTFWFSFDYYPAVVKVRTAIFKVNWYNFPESKIWVSVGPN